MENSYSSWRSINEMKVAKGKQTIKDPQTGKKQKIAYKIQSDNKILIRLVKMLSITDAAGNLTQQGASILVEYMNTQLAIVSSLPEAKGGINDNWFKKYAFIYTVKKDTQMREDEGPAQNGREKIQLTVVNRADFPMIPAGARFVNTTVVEKGVSAETSPVVTDIIQDNQQSVTTDNTEEGANIIPEDQKTEDATGTQETASLSGKKFRYTMRTNNKTYLMEFTEDGAIDAVVIGEAGPNGVVSYQTEGSDWKIMWITDEDSDSEDWTKEWMSTASKTLFTDQEITNRIDRDFLYKMFTNKEFRDGILAEYESEFGESEVSAENLRNLLYYKNGSAIFPKAGEKSQATGSVESEPESEKASALYQQRTF
jgi:hypothetical protein